MILWRLKPMAFPADSIPRRFHMLAPSLKRTRPFQETLRSITQALGSQD